MAYKFPLILLMVASFSAVAEITRESLDKFYGIFSKHLADAGDDFESIGRELVKNAKLDIAEDSSDYRQLGMIGKAWILAAEGNMDKAKQVIGEVDENLIDHRVAEAYYLLAKYAFSGEVDYMIQCLRTEIGFLIYCSVLRDDRFGEVLSAFNGDIAAEIARIENRGEKDDSSGLVILPNYYEVLYIAAHNGVDESQLAPWLRYFDYFMASRFSSPEHSSLGSPEENIHRFWRLVEAGSDEQKQAAKAVLRKVLVFAMHNPGPENDFYVMNSIHRKDGREMFDALRFDLNRWVRFLEDFDLNRR